MAPLRARLGPDTPSLGELALRGAQATLRELEAQDRARSRARSTFVDRLRAAPSPDFDEILRIRHAGRTP
jgi:hypothetical protein